MIDFTFLGFEYFYNNSINKDGSENLGTALFIIYSLYYISNVRKMMHKCSPLHENQRSELISVDCKEIIQTHVQCVIFEWSLWCIPRHISNHQLPSQLNYKLATAQQSPTHSRLPSLPSFLFLSLPPKDNLNQSFLIKELSISVTNEPDRRLLGYRGFRLTTESEFCRTPKETRVRSLSVRKPL